MPDMTLPKGLQVFERGWLSSNNVLFLGGESCALVDSGYSTHSDQTVELAQSALRGRSLNLLLNTHLHSDHCGGNAALQQAYPGLTTLIPPGQADLVAIWDAEALTYLPTGQLCPRFKYDGCLLPGAEIPLADVMWQIHAAPGHDPHSLVLFEPSSRTLISADALWEKGFGVVFPELEGERAFGEVGATLDLIEQLDPRWVIPGHGPVFMYRAEVLARSRERLDAFVKNPARHAHHAAKVLLKFKLLEQQQLLYADFANWAAGTRYFQLIRERFFLATPMVDWIAQLTDELVRSAVALKEGAMVFNA
ncbi:MULTISPECIES: MBL fold metallo-hydrolase [unclassified Polaromonas]|jgi:glyoxylase-like metal-dependent hydrolase (beta-lactamase superfamily II)|uniref:MBL fold metallo-hydrolase n=1 Tax=unclassified Polaromonas TaxID=2638319 RepID=UPI000BC9F002|nr:MULTISPECIES: MBL fold metallo-hydrolase [unclassified Polaromonas]OYY35701.1 MAG: MBL fold metallo-hydrolase [Polaromonas sp. 35-63-35]OYZ19996.1 MAG: MBL fold metallo-hydrolase [Polaromonas sp. 16-63-31]OYZ76870.1 MAG: MBL fold metallo-hydrolase [Polaromonas sp. 24-63-21]OZA51854.1 MAG: MBL fold metallo-hydrolase [Polaromonas sp. 17-63-33]OZA88113.1 MAG: MBL fold metallo-hydrolase [Polaromonas sp. 39-63-25]